MNHSKPTLLIATRNQHKALELGQMLAGKFDLLTLKDFPGAPEVLEDAPTFAGNAAKKALALANWLVQEQSALAGRFPNYVLADDSGLEVDALNGAPGVLSARFAALDSGSSGSGNSSDAANNAKLIRLLEPVAIDQRTGRFQCVIALVKLDRSARDLKNEVEFFSGSCEGRLNTVLTGQHGFGYDPLFVPQGYGETFAELSDTIKNQISHRAQALKKLRLRFAEND